MIRKILIVSDSHGKSKNVARAIDKERPDMLIHLGDIEDDPMEIVLATKLRKGNSIKDMSDPDR